MTRLILNLVGVLSIAFATLIPSIEVYGRMMPAKPPLPFTMKHIDGSAVTSALLHDSLITTGKGWSYPSNVSHNATPSDYPSVALDSAGAIHVVWLDENSGHKVILYTTNSPAGNWSMPVALPILPNRRVYDPLILINSKNQVYVLWYSYNWEDGNHPLDNIAYSQKTSTGWTAPQNVSPDEGHLKKKIYAVVDKFDTIHLIWDQCGSTSTGRPKS